jgi:Uma2 family endonuclease
MMKAVMPEVPEHLLAWRRKIGADRWDEMWEGVLHMPPSPNREHQNLEWAVETWLREHWGRPGGHMVYHEINVASVGRWPNDYRVPDLVLLSAEQLDVDQDEYFEGPPTVVVEIHSPGDETYEKLPFYAKLGVPEVWIIDRDSRRPEVYLLRTSGYGKEPPDSEGWVQSGVTGVRLRSEAGAKLALQMAGDDASRRLLPED